jgi:hypothetical protein
MTELFKCLWAKFSVDRESTASVGSNLVLLFASNFFFDTYQMRSCDEDLIINCRGHRTGGP